MYILNSVKIDALYNQSIFEDYFKGRTIKRRQASLHSETLLHSFDHHCQHQLMASVKLINWTAIHGVADNFTTCFFITKLFTLY